MKQPGQIVLFRFPQTDLAGGKLRPALLLCALPGGHDDWLICMISTQIRHHVPQFDEIIKDGDDDFDRSGLKATSLVRVGRLAVIEGRILLGKLGSIDPVRLQRIKSRLADWIGNPVDGDCGTACGG